MSEFNIEAAAQRIQGEFARMDSPSGVGASEKQGDGSFGNVLKSYLKETNEMQQGADMAAEKLMRGESDNVQDVMLAMSKADISFRMMIQVRSKLLEAYQEVMRMQV